MPQRAPTPRYAPKRLRAVLAASRKHQVVTACLLACAAHTGAKGQTAYGIPSAERAKGPAVQLQGQLAAWKEMIEASRLLSDQEKLEAVNRFFNRALLFANDIDTWGREDHWATPMEFMERGRGDCEDFAIAKYVTLRMLGLGGDRLRLMYVHANVGGAKPIAHMVVGFYEQPGAEPLVLDNVIDSVRPASMREDLNVVYSFNTRGLWVGDGRQANGDPNKRLSRWRGMLQRMRGEGMLAWSPSLAVRQSLFRNTAFKETVVQR